jgi:hypothetical protein
MTNPHQLSSPDPKTIWKEQKMTTQTLTPTQLEGRYRRLEGRVRSRNRFEYIAGGIVAVAAFALAAWMLTGGVQNAIEVVAAAGFLLLGAGAIFVCLQLRRRTSLDAVIDGSGGTFARYRAELVRQRDTLRSVLGWYIAPFLPGFLLIYGSVFLDPDVNWVWAAIPAVITLVFLGWVLNINRKAADCIDEEIRAIDRG